MTYLSSWVSWRYPMSASPDLPVEEAGSVATPHLFGDGVALTLPNRAYKQLTALYAAVRNAYADKVGFVADPLRKRVDHRGFGYVLLLGRDRQYQVIAHQPGDEARVISRQALFEAEGFGIH